MASFNMTGPTSVWEEESVLSWHCGSSGLLAQRCHQDTPAPTVLCLKLQKLIGATGMLS